MPAGGRARCAFAGLEVFQFRALCERAGVPPYKARRLLQACAAGAASTTLAAPPAYSLSALADPQPHSIAALARRASCKHAQRYSRGK